MAKPLFRDIVPPEKRSIKKITKPTPRPRFEADVPARTYEPRQTREEYTPEPIRTTRYIQETPRRETYEEDPIDQRDEEEPVLSRRPSAPRRKGGVKKSRIIFTLVALLIICGIAFMFISRVSGAWVTVTPKNETVSVNSSFTAIKSVTTGTSTLQFQTVTIAKDGKLGIAANGEEVANTKASGTIIIYNTTSSAQKLIANTRFETPKGLIFRISQPVTVPAQQGTTPGSIEAVVTADAIGPDYNVGLSDFSIPGFKGDAKYTQIYARSKIAIQGGFSGTRKKVSDTDVKAARQKIDDELKANLVREAQKDIPNGFVLPQNSYFIEYESLADTPSDTGVQINERATFHGIIFNRTTLAQEISKKVTGQASGPADLDGIDNLAFTLKASTTTKPWDENTLSFSLNGTTTLVSLIDSDKLKAELVGKPRKSLNAILAAYPGITNAEVTMRPFWKTSFPANQDEIFITVVNKKQ